MTRKDNFVSKLEKKISIELSSAKLIYLLFKSLIAMLNTHTVLYCSTDKQKDYYITIHLTLSTYYIYQIVHGTKGHMAIFRPGCHPQNIIWTEAKLRSIYYCAGDRPVHKLPFGPKRHELFVILYSIHANLSSTAYFVIVYQR